MDEFVVYVLYSEKYSKYYTGFTSGLIERFKSHNVYSNKGFTKKFRPWVVIHVEFFDNKGAAMVREKYLKSGHGRNFLKSILNE